MSLTIGNGPFAQPKKAGERFNFAIESPEHILYFEDCPKRIRVVFNKVVIADSREVKMLHETGMLPVYYFPKQAIQFDYLQPTDHHTACPFKGKASYWTLKVGEREAENAVWSYPEPLKEAPAIEGYFAFYWDVMDAWLAEDERLIGHPRDPYHRIDVLPGTYKVTVSVHGEKVAETYRPMLLFETGLPTRYYIPREDVFNEKLLSSPTQTICPYKGYASYWSVKTESEVVKDLVWGYRNPLPEASKVAGYACFLQEAESVEMEVTEL